MKDIWVDPVKGSDDRSGATAKAALRTIGAAWSRVPGTGGCRITLLPGDYPESSLPANGWMESRRGSAEAPVIIESADPRKKARLHGYLNILDCEYLYLIGLELVTDRGQGGGGNVLHIEKGDHILIRGCRLSGFDGVTRQPQETLKINQSRYIYVEDCDISGAFWFALDFMGVHYGHIVGNKLHDTGDDCCVLKGGTSNLLVEGNEIYDSANTGFTAGQGSGLEFLVVPWIHYDACDLKFVNNIVHDVQNAGAAVRGGYNILIACNTFYKVALNSDSGASLLLLSPGSRGSNGNVEACRSLHDAGAWGPVDGEAKECIPNRNVYIYNNIFYNPAPSRTKYGHIGVFGPVDAPPHANIASPVRSDDNLRIKGNIFWNGPADLPLGIEDEGQGCRPSNTLCNETTIRQENWVNVEEPALVNPGAADFRPLPQGNVFKAPALPIPDFPGGDAPTNVPPGDLRNAVSRDYRGEAREFSSPPGAYSR